MTSPTEPDRGGHLDAGRGPAATGDGNHAAHAGHDRAAEAPAPAADGPHAGHGNPAAARGRHADHGVPAAAHGDHAAHGAGRGAHDRHAGHDPEVFRRKFWLSLLLTIPVIAFSEMVQGWFGYSLDGVPGHRLVPPVLGTAVFVYGGLVFLRGGWRELRWRQPRMTLLISFAISVAFLTSAASEVGLLDLEFWWELAALIAVMLLGHWQEMRALGITRGALAALAGLLLDEAERIEDGGPRTVPIADLQEGDLVLVRPGARVPADGRVEEGAAEFDQSMITGESRPVARAAGERVAAGTVASAPRCACG